MRHILLIFLSLLLFSCNNDDDNFTSQNTTEFPEFTAFNSSLLNSDIVTIVFNESAVSFSVDNNGTGIFADCESTLSNLEVFDIDTCNQEIFFRVNDFSSYSVTIIVTNTNNEEESYTIRYNVPRNS